MKVLNNLTNNYLVYKEKNSDLLNFLRNFFLVKSFFLLLFLSTLFIILFLFTYKIDFFIKNLYILF